MVIKKIEQQVNDDYALDESCDLFVSLYSMLRNMESKESPDHRTRILKWALKQLPIKAHSKAVTEHEDLIKASSLLSIEQSLLPYEMGYDLAFGITKENLKYLALKRLNLLPDLSSSKLINEYVKGFWINKDKTEMDSQFWYYFFFPPFRLGKQFNKDLVSSLLNIFKSKSFHDNKATIKYINQLPPSAFIMAFAPPLLRNSFSARWVIYGLNFRETGQFIYSIFGNKTCIPPEFSNWDWAEMGVILSIKNGQLLPVYGLEFVLSKNTKSKEIFSLLKLFNANSQINPNHILAITKWISKNPAYSTLHPENLGGKLWLNHLKFTIQQGAIHSFKSYFGLAWSQPNLE